MEGTGSGHNRHKDSGTCCTATLPSNRRYHREPASLFYRFQIMRYRNSYAPLLRSAVRRTLEQWRDVQVHACGRRKVHDLFQKQQGILLCAASEGYDHQYINLPLAVTGIHETNGHYRQHCQLLFVADAAGFSELSTLYVTSALDGQPEKCSVSPQQQELFVLSIKINISQQYHR